MIHPGTAGEDRKTELGASILPALLLLLAFVALVLAYGGHQTRKKPPEARPRRRRREEHSSPRVFTSFAVEDKAARTLFVGQSKHEDTPFELADFSLHRPFDNAWKTQTRPRIKGCDVVVVLIGKGTHAAEGVLWEIKTALEEGVPVFGIFIDRDNKGRKPGLLFGIPVINWTWAGIAKQMRKAMRKSARRSAT